MTRGYCVLCTGASECYALEVCAKGFDVWNNKENGMAVAPQPKCRWCGQNAHGGVWCPLIKSIEYETVHDNIAMGAIKRVEFHEPQSVDGVRPVVEQFIRQWLGRPITDKDQKS
jgi:hypothetical protein